MSSSQLVWLITGVSSGLGLHLAQIVLARGDKVIATERKSKQHDDLPTTGDNLRMIQLDLDWDTERIQGVVQDAIKIWGRIDVLVNNAGYSHKGLAEEVGSSGYKKQFQTNFFGLMDVTNGVLPHMRERKAGTIVNIGSRTSWWADYPGASIYGSSKAALRVYSEGLATEIAPFNIRMLIVEPASFKSDSIQKTPWDDHNPIPDYAEFVKRIPELLAARESSVKGDPHKGMSVVVDVVRGEGVAVGKEWPKYLLLGELAVKGFREKTQTIERVVEQWEEVLVNLDSDD